MDREHLESSLREIRHLLSHLHGEVTALEQNYNQVLSVLRRFETVADLDDLTGLLRRRAFFRKWQTLLEKCQSLGENCGVLMIDIDHFKKINDTHGHATGDEVLRRVSELLKRFESPRCFAGRLGGEEFAVVVAGTDAEILGAGELIRRGAERLHGPVLGADGKEAPNVEWRCTLSAGMASSSKAGYEPTRILKAADEALYQAKAKGRNQVRAA
ncbi:MAG: GGDEF domain-containing protein [Oligoflexia bacterium]|nr:GGDEF domain-containing protein [Oligoflexia bacterium]